MHGRVDITRQLAGRSKDLSKELDGIADRAFEVAKLARELEEQHARPQADATTQCSLGAADPVYLLDRSQRLKPFEFQPLSKRQLDGKTWQKIRTINIDKMVGESDGRLLMNFYGDIANADLEADSGYNLTQANLIKLCQVCQLMMQWQQWQVEQGHHAVQVLTEEISSLQAGLSLIPSNIGLTDIDHSLAGLGNNFARVADTDMDLMFRKARAEEREGRQQAPASTRGPAAASSEEGGGAMRSSTRADAGADSLTGYVRKQQQQQQQQAPPPQPALHHPQLLQLPPAPHTMCQPELVQPSDGQQYAGLSQPPTGTRQHPLQPQYVAPPHSQPLPGLHQHPLQLQHVAPPQSQPPPGLHQQPLQLQYNIRPQPQMAGGYTSGPVRSVPTPFPSSSRAPPMLSSSASQPAQQASAAQFSPQYGGASMLGGPAPHASVAQVAGAQQSASMLPLRNPNLPTGLPTGPGPLQRARGAATGSHGLPFPQ